MNTIHKQPYEYTVFKVKYSKFCTKLQTNCSFPEMKCTEGILDTHVE